MMVYTTRTVVISGLSIPIHLDVVYVMPCMCGDISCQLIFLMNMHVKIFSTFEVWPLTEYSGCLYRRM